MDKMNVLEIIRILEQATDSDHLFILVKYALVPFLQSLLD